MTAHRSTPVFVGREVELARLEGVLAKTAGSGRGGVVLVDGESGMGKTRLLREAAERAGRNGYACALSSAEPWEPTPMSPLLSALGESPATTLSAVSPAQPWTRRSTDRVRTLDDLRDRLAERSSRRRLLIALDDLQSADLATLKALQALPSRLAEAPVLWILACRAPADAPSTDQLWGALEDDGAQRLELHRLTEHQVHRLVAALLDATPDEALSSLVAGASGNPRLVVELTAGMLDEGRVTAAGTDAGLLASHLPQRLERVLRRRFAGLADSVWQLLQAAAVLGSTVTVDDVAAMLLQPPVKVLAALQAAVTAGVLASRGDALDWRYELERQWVLLTLPGAVRATLQRQRLSIHQTARAEPLTSPPHGPKERTPFEAADSTRLTAAAQAVEAVEALSTTGQAPEASQLVSAVLASSLTAGASEADPTPDRERRGNEAVVRSLVELARGAWGGGRVEEALALTRQALTMATVGQVRLGNDHPAILLSSMLTDLRRLADADVAIRLLRKALGPESTASSPAPDVASARVHYVVGRLDVANAQGESGLAMAELAGASDLVPVALAVLAGVALRRGDVHAAMRWSDRVASELLEGGQSHAHVQPLWTAAQVTQAHPGGSDLEQVLRKVLEDPVAVRCLLLAEPAAGAWVVRRRSERSTAEAVVAEAEALAAGNRALVTVQAAAEHARGLLEHEADPLERACQHHQDPWARASAEEDFGVLLAAQGHQAQAVVQHQRAVEQYDASGSSRDSARVRSRLRQLGVRTRYWAQDVDRPVSGWASLTETERHVADLVASGLTNRQAAGQLFVSSHTVSFHLRQVFRKLGVTSRVELARRAANQRVVDEPRS